MYFPQSLSEIKKYRPASLRIGKEWYVSYYVFSHTEDKMVRKKIRLNYIEDLKERKRFALNLVRDLNRELSRGWNPYLSEEEARSYSPLIKVIDEFISFNRKKLEDGELRDMSFQSYASKLKIFKDYLAIKKMNDLYVYHFNKDLILQYLDYVYVGRKNSTRTRDNHLKTIRIFCNYLKERSYLKTNPADTIQVVGKSRGKQMIKNREIVGVDLRARISDFLRANNRGFLLIVELIYFCMIRPKEITHLKVRNINFDKGTIFIPGEISKNWKDAVVTMPLAIVNLIEELQISDFPGDYYIFSDGFLPGKAYRRSKQMNDYWARVVRPALGLSLNVKMYSFKDTGITDMIREYGDPLIVRDQARHRDLSITNIYTPHDSMNANERIITDQREF